MASLVHCQGGQWTSVALQLDQRRGHTGRPQRHTAIEVAQLDSGVAGIMGHAFESPKFGSDLSHRLTSGGVQVAQSPMVILGVGDS